MTHRKLTCCCHGDIFSTQQPEPISAAYKLQEYRIERFLGRGKAALFGLDRSTII